MIKKWIIIVFLLFPIYCSYFSSKLINHQLKNAITKLNYDSDKYTYVRELRNGVWWIIVFNEDGIIVNEYPDPNQ